MVERLGGCLCGGVRYCAVGEPIRVGICHCQDCRRASGTGFTYYAIWPLSQFSFNGEISTFHGRSFCPTCGSRLFTVDADEAEVMVGTLDDAPSNLAPSYELWMGRREPWLPDLPTEKFARDREDVPVSD